MYLINIPGSLFRRISPEIIVLPLVLIGICLHVWSRNAPNVMWDIALSGFSPIDWINHLEKPANFARDFPNGMWTYEKSLFMHLYRLADVYLGILPEQLILGVILFEMLFLAGAIALFYRALMPEASAAGAFVLAMWVVNSGARSMELANFGGPFFWGLYYNFADGMRLLALALILHRRFLLAATLFALSAMTHPLIGGMGGVFALGCLVADRRGVTVAKLFFPAVAFLLLVGVWWLYQLHGAEVAASGFSSETWIAYTKAFNYHFYPVENGQLTYDFERRLLGFCTLILVALYYLSRIDLSEITKNGILIGGGLLMIVTVAGLMISHWSSSPALIKLTLHRASDMLILICLAVTAAGLIRDVEEGGVIQAAGAVGLLLSPFVGPPFPVIYAFLMVIAGVLPCWKNMSRTDGFVVGLLVLFALFLIAYFRLGYVHAIYQTAYVGHKYLWVASSLAAAAALGINALRRSLTEKLRVLYLWVVLLVAVQCALGWTGGGNHRLEERPQGVAYMSAQLWAREHTSESALFMVDPTIYYGWRDFSERSSFGNMREWLHTSWLYDSKRENYEEGLRRAAEFGIDPSNYLNEKPPLKGFDLLDRDFGGRFYSYDTGWFLNMSRKYSIDYLVMKKARLTRELRLPIAYENDFFVIFRLPSRE